MTRQLPEKLKLADKEVVTLTFLDDGDYYFNNESVGFEVKKDGEESTKMFYVNSNNFTFLEQINKLGKLIGTKAKITRHGTTKSNTRYFIESV